MFTSPMALELWGPLGEDGALYFTVVESHLLLVSIPKTCYLRSPDGILPHGKQAIHSCGAESVACPLSLDAIQVVLRP